MLEELKAKLKITWDDEDSNLNNIIEEAKSDLEELAGVPLNFEGDNSNKSLLLNYCRYSYNNATEYFQSNFKSQILRLQLKSAVKSNVKNE